MSNQRSNKSRRERRRAERQRQQARNLVIFGLIAVVVAVYLIWQSSRPVDLVEVASREFAVPVNGLTIGNPDAVVEVEVFEDFQCPACKSFNDTVEPGLFQAYVNTGEVRFTFRHYPFIGDESWAAANAAMCANEQGKFWGYHDMLFANQLGENIGTFSDKRLLAIGEFLDLDMASFESCFEDRAYNDVINDSFLEARDRDVIGTPTVFVNGQRFYPADPQLIQNAIDIALVTAPAP